MVVMAAVYLQWVSVSGGLGGQQTYTEERWPLVAQEDSAVESTVPDEAEVVSSNLTEGLPHYFPPTLYPTVIPTLAPPPTPVAQAVAYTPVSVGVEQWRSLVASIFPADTVDAVLRVMRCESGGNPNAVSPTNDHGLMQINAVNFGRFGGRSPYDPQANLEVAYAMSGGGYSWGAWSCKP